MNTAARTPLSRSWWLLAGAVAAVAIAFLIAAGRTTAAPAVAVAEGAAAVVAPAPLVLPEHASVLVFGDSWTYGSAATDPTLGYAYVIGQTLGWETHVDGVRGSGYLKPGIDGGSFGERIAALDPGLDPDLVIIEGSINDRVLYPEGYTAAVTSAWDALSALYPDAAIVILGPAPQVLPVQRATARIDDDLAHLAADRGWWYVSPVQDDWITPENYGWVIDASEIGRDHPSTAGHAYLAERLADAIAAMSEGTDITADAG
ncbi:SGNH/GDSL hydrolase family protein [Microbacterium sp. P5_E9]